MTRPRRGIPRRTGSLERLALPDGASLYVHAARGIDVGGDGPPTGFLMLADALILFPSLFGAPLALPLPRIIPGGPPGLCCRAMKRILVPVMIALSGAIMASAWLAHLRYRDRIGFWVALVASWALVLPEYALNVAATRYGYGAFTGGQMAAFHLCSGVVCVTLVSHFVLGEALGLRQLSGFFFLALGMVLLLRRG